MEIPLPKTLAQVKRRLEEAMNEASDAEELIPLMKKAIAQFDLEPGDLFEQRPESSRLATPNISKARDATAQAKAVYQDADGNTWAGRGRRPTWLNEALERGKTLEDFKRAGARARKAK
ncbi:H-NS histone family protein [Acidovorax sp. SUPP2522]|uniref:H-NS histone family protein n=1 Tax=unclassified Acidovorax TaxID=2684926 RepID=UPI00234AFE03|nr:MULTISPECIES: H-NS histone family protein [unclassified Acidovorax]WCN00151.1 H-NS histone family protein [Acidovorax sp. GBBC 1281]GKT17005.1 H-NS histone family protein [Acidovorax sp. SUPP2522]